VENELLKLEIANLVFETLIKTQSGKNIFALKDNYV